MQSLCIRFTWYYRRDSMLSCCKANVDRFINYLCRLRPEKITQLFKICSKCSNSKFFPVFYRAKHVLA